MGTKRDPECHECGGDGWMWDYSGCCDPECCGGPYKVRCNQCDNDWTHEDDQ